MNNFMIDKETRDWLSTFFLFEIDFGTPISEGGHDENKVFIIPNMSWLVCGPANPQNWLHFKGEVDNTRCDHLFITMSGFYRALVNGLSHIPYECLMSSGDSGVVRGFFGDVNNHLKSYRAMKSYRGLLRKDIKQAREYKIKGNEHRLHKKIGFIYDGIALICQVIYGDQEKYIEFTGRELPLNDHEGFLSDARIIHDRLQLEINKMHESGKLPTCSADERHVPNAIHYVVNIGFDDDVTGNRKKIINLLKKEL